MEFEPNAYKVTLLFPMYDNSAAPFPESVWDWWRSEFTRVIPGYTEVGEVLGWWQGQTDRHRMVYVVVKPDDTTKLQQLRDFVAAARTQFRQAAMYFEMHPIRYEEL